MRQAQEADAKGCNYHVSIGARLTNNHTAYLIHSRGSELFVFSMTPQQAALEKAEVADAAVYARKAPRTGSCEGADRFGVHGTLRFQPPTSCRAITNLTEFFDHFRQLHVSSSEQLDELVQRAQQVVWGIEPHQLRDSGSLRQRVATQLTGVQSALDELRVDRPRGNIVRRPH